MNLEQERTTSRPPLRAQVDHDANLILIVDGRGELLALTFAEAADLVESMTDLLDVVGWPK